jgi:chlorite dismutase
MEISKLSNTIDQMDLTYKIFHSTVAEYTFFSVTYGSILELSPK